MSSTASQLASDLERRPAAIEELYRVPDNGKAEIIGETVVCLSPAGAGPGRMAGRICLSLSRHENLLSQITSNGYALGGNVGFLVDLPRRSSFSPGAAWYTGLTDEHEMDFLSGAPAFAVEVRSKGDYGPKAEQAISEKIRDYFAAGTLVVWDVDTRGIDVVRIHRAAPPDVPTIYRRGDVAEAEPAVSG